MTSRESVPWPGHRAGRWGGIALVYLLFLLASAPVASQTPDAAAHGFAEAWASGAEDQLCEWFAERVQLTVDGRTRTGVRPEQTVAALRSLLARFAGPAPIVVRAEPMGPRGESGFAELRWEARFRDSGTLRVHTFLLTFVRAGERLRISDLRIVV